MLFLSSDRWSLGVDLQLLMTIRGCVTAPWPSLVAPGEQLTVNGFQAEAEMGPQETDSQGGMLILT